MVGLEGGSLPQELEKTRKVGYFSSLLIFFVVVIPVGHTSKLEKLPDMIIQRNLMTKRTGGAPSLALAAAPDTFCLFICLFACLYLHRLQVQTPASVQASLQMISCSSKLYKTAVGKFVFSKSSQLVLPSG